jgi:hypothetical protein
METHLYFKILEVLDSYNVGEKTNLSRDIWEHFDNILAEDLTIECFKKINETVCGTLSELNNRKLINFSEYSLSFGNQNNPANWFDKIEINASITIEGVKYLQSERDNEFNRDFIKSQKDFLASQHGFLKSQELISWTTLGVSFASLMFIGFSTYENAKGGVEKELQKIVLSQKDLQKVLKEKTLLFQNPSFQIDSVKSVK